MLLTTWAKSLYKTCLSLNPETTFTQGWEVQKAHFGGLFVWPLNIAMIDSIRFGNFVAEPKPPAPIGNTVGYGTVKVSNPVPVYNTRVKVNDQSTPTI
jgi:hypothetical protein